MYYAAPFSNEKVSQATFEWGPNVSSFQHNSNITKLSLQFSTEVVYKIDHRKDFERMGATCLTFRHRGRKKTEGVIILTSRPFLGDENCQKYVRASSPQWRLWVTAHVVDPSVNEDWWIHSKNYRVRERLIGKCQNRKNLSFSNERFTALRVYMFFAHRRVRFWWM